MRNIFALVGIIMAACSANTARTETECEASCHYKAANSENLTYDECVRVCQNEQSFLDQSGLVSNEQRAQKSPKDCVAEFVAAEAAAGREFSDQSAEQMCEGALDGTCACLKSISHANDRKAELSVSPPKPKIEPVSTSVAQARATPFIEQ